MARYHGLRSPQHDVLGLVQSHFACHHFMAWCEGLCGLPHKLLVSAWVSSEVVVVF